MYRFFVSKEQVHDNYISIRGEDVNHILHVLRMKKGDVVYLSCEDQLEYECVLDSWDDEEIQARIVDVHGMETELNAQLVLYQGLPKGDKMDLIIQKAVELGASRIVPVRMKRSIVKLDEKKAKKKVDRWNAIALSAAKQSKRGIIPEVANVMNYHQAIEDAKDLDLLLVPYESQKGMAETRELLEKAKEQRSIGIVIGPEGGFDQEEIAQVKNEGGHTITLGKRILRTETAGMTMLSILMFMLEE